MNSDFDPSSLLEGSEPSTTAVAGHQLSATDPAESRRSFLTMGLSGAILAGFASRARAQSAPPGSFQPAPNRVPRGDVRFLVDRITNGWNAEAWARVEQIGYDAYLEEQLAYTSIDDSALAPTLALFPTLTLTSKQLYDQFVAVNQTGTVVTELKTATVMRAAFSKRQLFERMVEFWSDHFSVDHADNQVQWLKTADDRDVIRVHALGNFHDLLLANARSAAMLFSLDNYRNFASAPNENYGREVMELHTLGVGNYAEADVAQVARCLTGWQYYNQAQPNHGDFLFNAAQHDNGTKIVLGNTILPNGVHDGEQVLALLASQPAAASFLARKMCRWLLAYTPPQAVIDAVAGAYMSTQGDIKSMVRVILSPRSVIQVSPAALPKIKRPFHLVASVLRTSTATITQPSRLVTELKTMGHMPFAWPAPNGYPEAAEVWGPAVLVRWNFLARFFGGLISGTTVPVATLFAGIAKSDLAAHANQILMGGTMDAADVAAVQSYATAATTLNDTLRRDVLALAASSPSFQLY